MLRELLPGCQPLPVVTGKAIADGSLVPRPGVCAWGPLLMGSLPLPWVCCNPPYLPVPEWPDPPLHSQKPL